MDMCKNLIHLITNITIFKKYTYIYGRAKWNNGDTSTYNIVL